MANTEKSKKEIQKIIDVIQKMITSAVDIIKLEFIDDPEFKDKITKTEADANQIIDSAQDLMQIWWQDAEPIDVM